MNQRRKLKDNWETWKRYKRQKNQYARLTILNKMKLKLFGQSSIIRIILVFIFLACIFISMKNDQTISYGHIPAGKVQEWKNVKDNIKVQFAYFPDKPIIDIFTALNFSVQDLKTDEHIKDFTAREVVRDCSNLKT
jgi:hypothetical protein